MNWLRKISQGKPFPLPFDVPDRQDHAGPIIFRGKTRIDDTMTQDTADEEQRRNEEMSYLGVGSYGIVADLGNGMVLKYIASPNEAETARRVMQTKPPCVVKIHEVRELQDDLWGIVMDKVRLLNSGESYQASAYKWYWISITEGMSLEEFVDRSSYVPEKFTHEFYDKYAKMLICLRENKIPLDDVHGDNCGYDNEGNLVVFDIGDVS